MSRTSAERLMTPSMTAAARDRADLRDVEDFAHFGFAQVLVALDRRASSPCHRQLHVVERLIDDVVQFDIDTFLLGESSRPASRTNVEADDDRVACLGQVDVALGDAATPD